MNIFVVNKKTFDELMIKHGLTKENVSSDKIHFFICIHDSVPRDENDKPYFENGPNTKVLFFDDVDSDSEVPLLGSGEKYQAKAFTAQQAAELLDFLDNNKDKQTCIVHCSAGYSRSGGVGAFINDYFRCNYQDFKRKNPHIKANNLVIRLMKAAMFNKYSEDI